MKTRSITTMARQLAAVAVLTMAALAPAMAGHGHGNGHGHYLGAREIAEITGMRVQEVRLMTGAYSNNVYYRSSFNRISRQWKAAVEANDLLLTQARDSRGNAIVKVSRAAASPLS